LEEKAGFVRWKPGSVRLCAAEFDHFGPLLGFFSDELFKIGGRARKQRCSEFSKPYLRRRIVEDRIDRPIKLVDDLAGLTSALDPVEHYILNVRLGLPFRKVSA
jgi:hypothetical protein